MKNRTTGTIIFLVCALLFTSLASAEIVPVEPQKGNIYQLRAMPNHEAEIIGAVRVDIVMKNGERTFRLKNAVFVLSPYDEHSYVVEKKVEGFGGTKYYWIKIRLTDASNKEGWILRYTEEITAPLVIWVCILGIGVYILGVYYGAYRLIKKKWDKDTAGLIIILWFILCFIWPLTVPLLILLFIRHGISGIGGGRMDVRREEEKKKSALDTILPEKTTYDIREKTNVFGETGYTVEEKKTRLP